MKNESQYIYKDLKRDEKARLVRMGEDWYVCEAKSISDLEAEWTPFIAGTADFLALTEQDKDWAIDKAVRE